jgi:hypothetical protein
MSDNDLLNAARAFRDKLVPAVASPSYVAQSMRLVASDSDTRKTEDIISDLLEGGDGEVSAATTVPAKSLPILQQSSLEGLERAVEDLSSAAEAVEDSSIFFRLAKAVLEDRKTLVCRDDDVKRLCAALPPPASASSLAPHAAPASSTYSIADALRVHRDFQEALNVFSTYDTAARLNSTAIEELAETLQRELRIASPTPSPAAKMR